MKPVLIVENNTNSLSINENADMKKGEYILGGTFTEFDVKNRNERIYTAQKFLPCLNELMERMNNLGVVYGEFDHPDVFDTSLSRASHLIKAISYNEGKNIVEGEIKLLSTYWGKEAKALVGDGCPLFVSSRAAGVTEANGTVALKKLFTYDIVADPGFGSAKMNVRCVNESFGFGENTKTNFRIYEMSDESKINDLFNMNANEYVTKKQLTDYSKYLVNELASTKKEVKSAIKTGDLTPKKMEQLLEYYEELNKTNNQMVKYLDYLAEKVQVVVNENTSLKTTTDKLIKHNDYLAENLEKSIKYSEYLAESVDKNIAYSEYIAENLDKNIAYSEYIAENLDKNIAYSEYIAENVDKNIAYSEYIAENVDNNIAYSEYLAEHVEGNIAYSEYIAENLDDSIAYTDYIAENLDKSIIHTNMIVEKINGGKLFENYGETLPTSIEAGIEELYDEEENEIGLPEYEEEMMPEMEAVETVEEITETVEEEGYELCGDEEEGEGEYNNEMVIPVSLTESELSKQIDSLISEAKKREASEKTDLHFLKFLNKSQVDSFNSLESDDREKVILYLNEKSYFSSSDVLRLMNESLSVVEESLEEKLIRLMPDSVKTGWEKLSESAQKSVLSQARLHPNISNEITIEHFWLTRNLKTNESLTKKLLSETNLIQEDRLSDNEMTSILERFKSI